MRLDQLEPGAQGIVARVGGARAFRNRLMELGLVPGTPVVCVGRSPLGDPMRYRVRDAVVGLRRSDAAFVELVDETR